jgi:predicted GIY-YIG superfamily endonuclease
MYYTYILKMDDGTCYTGYTSDIEERLAQHDRGSTTSTSTSHKHQLLFYAAFPDKMKALAFEKYLKSSSGHAFRKKHLI